MARYPSHTLICTAVSTRCLAFTIPSCSSHQDNPNCLDCSFAVVLISHCASLNTAQRPIDNQNLPSQYPICKMFNQRIPHSLHKSKTALHPLNMRIIQSKYGERYRKSTAYLQSLTHSHRNPIFGI